MEKIFQIFDFNTPVDQKNIYVNLEPSLPFLSKYRSLLLGFIEKIVQIEIS